MRDYRIVWPFLVSPLLVIGLMLSVGQVGVVVCLTLFGSVSLLTGIYGFIYSPFTRAPLRRVVRAGLWTGAAVAAAPGLVDSLGPGALVLLALVALTSPAAVGLAARTLTARSDREAPFPAATPAAPTVDSRLDELAVAWRASYAALQRAPDLRTALAIVELRAGMLDRLERSGPENGPGTGPATGPGWTTTLARVTPSQLQAVGRYRPSPPHRHPPG